MGCVAMVFGRKPNQTASWVGLWRRTHDKLRSLVPTAALDELVALVDEPQEGAHKVCGGTLQRLSSYTAEARLFFRPQPERAYLPRLRAPLARGFFVTDEAGAGASKQRKNAYDKG